MVDDWVRECLNCSLNFAIISSFSRGEGPAGAEEDGRCGLGRKRGLGGVGG